MLGAGSEAVVRLRPDDSHVACKLFKLDRFQPRFLYQNVRFLLDYQETGVVPRLYGFDLASRCIHMEALVDGWMPFSIWLRQQQQPAERVILQTVDRVVDAFRILQEHTPDTWYGDLHNTSNIMVNGAAVRFLEGGKKHQPSFYAIPMFRHRLLLSTITELGGSTGEILETALEHAAQRLAQAIREDVMQLRPAKRVHHHQG